MQLLEEHLKAIDGRVGDLKYSVFQLNVLFYIKQFTGFNGMFVSSWEFCCYKEVNLFFSLQLKSSMCCSVYRH